MLKCSAIGLTLFAIAWGIPAHAAATAAASAAAPATASARPAAPVVRQVANPKEVWDSFDVQKIAALVREMGDAAQVQTVTGQNTFVNVKSANGFGLIVVPRACKTGKCYGLQIFAVFNATTRDLNDYNSAVQFTKAYLAEGKTVLSRYEIADVGTFKGDVAASLSNFKIAMADFETYLEAPVTAAAPAAPAAPPKPATPAKPAAPAKPATPPKPAMPH